MALPEVDRFVVEAEAGSGGMGTVYRARDRDTGKSVALKVVRDSDVDVGRFEREARVLAAVEDPGVVGYVAHGRTTHGAPYLAMEWLEGEDLAARLQRGPLEIDDALTLAARTARTLGALHAKGIVHRDLKPSNLFLVGGRVADAKILDFGVARRQDDASRLTRTGMIVGTPAYMSPEQARGQLDIDARADVFAFGCVLFEALAGRSPFAAETALAVLARILVDEPDSLEKVRPGVPRPVARLVGRLLAKDRQARPSDGAAIAAELPALADAELLPRSTRGAGEMRVVTLVLADATSGTEQTLSPADVREIQREARAIAEACGASLELMAHGGMVAILSGGGAATDLARAAATFALRSRPLFGGKPFAIATGRAYVTGQGVPVGEVLGRAASSLTTAPAGAIVLDATTASVLEGSFEVRTEGGRLELGEERSGDHLARRVLGRETPCVGRERELGGIAAMLDECFDESVARALVVTAPAGTGKSRLVDEALRSIRLRHPDARVVIARASPVGAGAAYALVSQFLRQLGVGPTAAAPSSLAAVVGAAVPGPAGVRALAFLREVAGLGNDETDDAVRAARSDPHLLAEGVRSAWVEAMRSLVGVAPLVLVIEDLHWGDLPSVALIDAVLGRLSERPLAVVATARPEVDAAFPGLWTKHAVQIVRLGAISRRAGERLVRSMMPEVAPGTLAAIIERAEGHPFFLEEIVRAIASGASPDVMPDTVLGTLQMRLDALQPGERSALRAAAVYGETFWKRGVGAIVPPQVDLDAALRSLVEGDLVERSTRGLLGGEEEYVLRHGLVRDAAYALLPDTERASAHELAGRWLESVGYDDASALAEHFDRAGAHDRALHHFRRAAQSALDGQDLARASRLVARARTHAGTDEDRGTLDAMDADVAFVRGLVADATVDGERALGRLRRGSRTWFRAASLVISSAGNQGNNDRVSRWASEVATSDADEDALGDRVVALARAVGQLAAAHEEQRVDALYARFEALAASASTSSAYVAGVAGRSRSFYLLWRRGDLFPMPDEAMRAADAFERAGMRNDQLNCLVLQGVARGQTGDLAGAIEAIRSAGRAAAAAGLPYVAAFARMELAVVLALHGRGAEALDEASASLDVLRGSERLTFHAHHASAMAALSAGDARRALDEAVLASQASVHPRLGSRALAVQAEAHLALGETEQALACARRAVERGAATSGWEICEGHCELALAEALEAAGDPAGARAAITMAAEHIARLAAFARSAEERAAFLAVPIPNARIRAFAERFSQLG